MTSDQKPPIKHAILLAAGKGTRLLPHTLHLPKPLLPVDGRASLDIIFESLAIAGIESVTVVTHYLEEQIADYLKQQNWLKEVSQCHQEVMDGTASAVLQALQQQTSQSQAKGTDSEFPLLITATDYLTAHDFYAEFLNFHASHSAQISVSLKRVPKEELSKRSSVEISDDGNIRRIVEKPPEGEVPGKHAANLLFVLPARVHDYLKDVKKSSRGEFEVQDAINAMLKDGHQGRGLLQDTPREWEPNMTGNQNFAKRKLR